MTSDEKKMYILSSNEETTYLADEQFEHYYKAKSQLEEITFSKEVDTLLVKTGLKLFKYHNYSSEIEVGIYGVPYCYGSIIKDSKVNEFPDYLRTQTQPYRVFAESDTLTSSGIYDMDEHRVLFEGLRMADLGNLYLEDTKAETIEEKTNQLYDWANEHKIMLMAIGGDHLLTYYSVLALARKHNEKLVIVIFDAHHDCRNSFPESKELNHANFVRELLKLESVEKIIQIGVRGIRSIATYIRDDKLLQINDLRELDRLREELESHKDCNLYMSIDLDVMDVTQYPYVDFIIPGGLTMMDMKQYLQEIFLHHMNLIGCDVVEGLPGKVNEYNQVPIQILSLLLDGIKRNQSKKV